MEIESKVCRLEIQNKELKVSTLKSIDCSVHFSKSRIKSILFRDACDMTEYSIKKD